MPAVRRTESTPWEAVPPGDTGPTTPGEPPRPARPAIPTGPWGRPARSRPNLHPAADPAASDPARPAAPPPSFRPVPPPPRPPGARPSPVPRRRPSPVAYRLLELAVAVLLLAGLAAAARPRSVPAPPCPEGAWAQRAAGASDALAADIGAGVEATRGGQSLSAGAVSRLAREATLLRAVGPPPDPASTAAWAQTIDAVTTAVIEARGGASAAVHSTLAGASLALTAVAASGCGPGTARS